MTSPRVSVRNAMLATILVLGAAPAIAGDLSRYRDFQLGADLPTVAKIAGMSESQALAIHRRPDLLQNLEWRPQTLNWSARAESARSVVFGFHNGGLFRIEVDYDRNETEGLTADDMVEAVSITYGIPTSYPMPARTEQTSLGDQEQALARWEDPQYRFELIRSSYGPSFRLVGVLKKLEAAALRSSLEATRLEDLEMPQREAARVAADQDAAKAMQGRARIVNKVKFRP